MYQVLKWVHVVAAAVWLGGNVMELALGAFNRDASAQVKRRLAENAISSGRMVFSPAGLLILLTGVPLVLMEEAWEFEQLWIVIGLIGVVAGAVNGAVVLSGAARSVVAAVDADDAVALGAAEGRIRMFSLYQLIMLLVVFGAMIGRWTV